MKKLIIAGILIIALLSACQKKVTPVDGSNAVITLKNDGAKYVTDNITVNPKDSLFFSFTITSNRDMKYVSIQKNPVNQTAFVVRDTLTAANKNSYTVTKKLVADSANGDYVYRIVAHDSGGLYIGHKDVIVSVKADFNFFTYRFLYVPDTTDKTNTCYLAATTGEVFSYTTGAAKSSLIDFGYFYDTTKVMAGSPLTLQPKGHTIYIPSANIFTLYDLSTWTKNATLFKATTVTMASVTSAGAIRTACIPALSAGTITRFSQTDRAATSIASFLTGQNFIFRTVSGKNGILAVNFTNNNGPNRDSYINVDVKIEK